VAKAKKKKQVKKPVKKPVKKQLKKLPKTTKMKSTTDMSNMFVPLDDRVLIERSDVATKTASGLFIPDSGQEQTNKGTVVCVGPGHKSIKGHLRPTSVKMGERVLFAKYAGTEIKIGDDEYIVLRETDIIGVLEK